MVPRSNSSNASDGIDEEDPVDYRSHTETSDHFSDLNDKDSVNPFAEGVCIRNRPRTPDLEPFADNWVPLPRGVEPESVAGPESEGEPVNSAEPTQLTMRQRRRVRQNARLQRIPVHQRLGLNRSAAPCSCDQGLAGLLAVLTALQKIHEPVWGRRFLLCPSLHLYMCLEQPLNPGPWSRACTCC
jgi:hypothetical protein